MTNVINDPAHLTLYLGPLDGLVVPATDVNAAGVYKKWIAASAYRPLPDEPLSLHWAVEPRHELAERTVVYRLRPDGKLYHERTIA